MHMITRFRGQKNGGNKKELARNRTAACVSCNSARACWGSCGMLPSVCVMADEAEVALSRTTY